MKTDELDNFWLNVGIADADQIATMVARRALRRVTWMSHHDNGTISLRETITDRCGRLAVIVRTAIVYGLDTNIARRIMVRASIDHLLSLDGVTQQSPEKIAQAA